MVNENAAFTASLKSGHEYDAGLITVRADSAAELNARLAELVQSPALGALAATNHLLKAAFNAGAIAAPPTVTPAAPAAPTAPPVQDFQGMSAPQTTADPWNGNQQVSQGGVTETTDRYGNRYTLNLPTAPRCEHGVMALVEKKKRDNTGTYKKWCCPVPVSSGFKAKTNCEEQWAN